MIESICFLSTKIPIKYWNGGAMRGVTVFKKSYNSALRYLSATGVRADLPSENVLAAHLATSRTTVRKILNELKTKRLVQHKAMRWTVVRLPKAVDFFPENETVSTSAQVEKKFMEWMMRGDRKEGDVVNGLDLARQFNVSTGAIREYLNRFGRFGLIEKRPNSSWIIRGFTKEFALELFEVRELFELRSALAFEKLSDDSPIWHDLKLLEREHKNLLRQISKRYHEFPGLDERFHRLVNQSANNRFFMDFYDIISLIFHYHYQWNKIDERQRNRAALLEHLDYITALFSKDPRRIELACKSHLNSARKTLLASIKPAQTAH
jgi:DNA-binding GntR family transcriptional regulator